MDETSNGAELWERLRAGVATHTDAKGEALLELAVASVRDCLNGNNEVRAEDRRAMAAFSALSDLVWSARGCDEVTLSCGSDGVYAIVVGGDTLFRDELDDAIRAMARARGLPDWQGADGKLAEIGRLLRSTDRERAWSSDIVQEVKDLLTRQGLRGGTP